MARTINSRTKQDPEDSAKAAGLRYSTACRPGFSRVRRGAGFRYLGPDGKVIRRREQLSRFKAIVIPPAWTDVWICADPRGHLQATGRDARGRKVYRYHSKWRQIRDETKYDRLIGFAHALPAIRRRTRRDLRTVHLSREMVLAAVVQLLEKTLIRVGNDEYAKENQSFGLTTMRNAHVRVNGTRLRFLFRGKSGVEHDIDLTDRRLARAVRACRDIPGYELFQFYDDEGKRQPIGSDDVNAYLKEITGQDYTSKDFRTWAGTVLAAQLLWGFAQCQSDAEAKSNIVEAVGVVAKRLGNTKAVCRKSYIHPAVFDDYLGGSMKRRRPARGSRVVDASAGRVEFTETRRKRAGRKPKGLSEAEAAVLALLQRHSNSH
jgi:DNA topoisomerase I